LSKRLSFADAAILHVAQERAEGHVLTFDEEFGNLTGLYALDARRDALVWTESLTFVHQNHVPDELFQKVRGHFNGTKITELTLAIGAINTWNRIAIFFRMVPGGYQPAKASATVSASTAGSQ
jgi:alkylhydroperoxidase family enzyme